MSRKTGVAGDETVSNISQHRGIKLHLGARTPLGWRPQEMPWPRDSKFRHAYAEREKANAVET